MEFRKAQEAAFHDRLRGEALKKDEEIFGRLTSNIKFYSVARKSRKFVERWLLEKSKKGERVLDYCCGNGEISIFLAKNRIEVFGIDISREGIEKAIKRAVEEGVEKNAHFRVMDAEKLEFEDNYFDVILCSGVLHHLDIKKAYPELERVIKKNGEILCNEPLAYNPIFQLYRRLTPHLRTKWEREHILTRKEIELASKYFDRVETKFFHLATLAAFPFRNLPGFNFLLSFFEGIDSILLRIPFVKWLAWQVVYILSNPKK